MLRDKIPSALGALRGAQRGSHIGIGRTVGESRAGQAKPERGEHAADAPELGKKRNNDHSNYLILKPRIRGVRTCFAVGPEHPFD